MALDKTYSKENKTETKQKKKNSHKTNKQNKTKDKTRTEQERWIGKEGIREKKYQISGKKMRQQERGRIKELYEIAGIKKYK